MRVQQQLKKISIHHTLKSLRVSKRGKRERERERESESEEGRGGNTVYVWKMRSTIWYIFQAGFYDIKVN